MSATPRIGFSLQSGGPSGAGIVHQAHDDLYRACFEHSPAAQMILGYKGDLIDINERACALLGQDRAALLGRRLPELVHADDQEALYHAIRRSTETGTPFEIECRLTSERHGLRWFLAQSGPGVTSGKGTIWYTLIADISERKRQEVWLSERNALLTALSHNLPGMVYVFRPGHGEPGRLEFVSEGVRELFGVTPEAVLADPWLLYQRMPPDEQAQFFEAARRAVAGQTRLHAEFQVRAPDGEWRWCAADSVAGVDPEGNELRCGYIADITEHKLYQEARVAAETAERASRAKSEFLSRMSHELRTPLNAVIGFAQLLRMDTQPALGEAQRRKVDLIERSGAHLLAVISDVLDLSRIEAGDMPLSVEPLQLAGVISDAQAMVAEAAQRSDVRMPDADMPAGVHVMADRVRLRQVLVNLLSNAVKYNRKGGEVRVQVRGDNGTVLISVIDTGMGLNPHQMAHLFEPFNRLGAEQKGIEGTGIGLVIVRRLVELMGGSIEVRSREGVGTAFQLRLQWVDVDPTSEHGGLDELPAPSRQAVVLYAEDNEVNVLLVRQILELRPSWRLEVARSGAEALRMVPLLKPDLLLLDMHLGDMSGFELVDLLDQQGEGQEVIKVALSADAMPDRIHAAKARGFVAYLTKPLDVTALLRCLDEHLA